MVHNGAMTTLQIVKPAAPEISGTSSGMPFLAAEQAQGKAQFFKALADPNRLRLLSIIKASDGGEACVCDLTAPLELGQPTVSHHLRILVDAGLLHREKRGTWAYYSIVPGALERPAVVLEDL